VEEWKKSLKDARDIFERRVPANKNIEESSLMTLNQL
jgi:hypothetical protein